MKNINTKQYWEERFMTGDWEEKGGENQTKQFAESQIKYIELCSNFSGTILDFGCGLGDAMPIYHKAFPDAKLVGIDISEQAIQKCKRKYDSIASFISGDHNSVPNVDVIIASNVFEHLTDDVLIATHLLKKCKQLMIIVPFREQKPLSSEHVNTYAENYFRHIADYKYKIFSSRGWSQYGINLIYHVYFKNILRPLFGKQIVKRAKQIMYIFNTQV